MTRIHYTAPSPFTGCAVYYICSTVWFSGFPVAIVEGKHPVPFRTRSLSLPTLMVLHEGSCGRVRRCRNTLYFFPLFFGGRNVCGCITLQPAWLEGDTPTHAYPRISLGPSQTVTDYRSHYWPGCRGIRVAWYYTIDPCVAMPRGRHG